MNSLTQHLEEQETLNEMKVVICNHDNRAYKDFRDDSGYWKHGEMRDVGVVADRMLEEIEPILRQSNIETIKWVMGVIEGMKETGHWSGGIEVSNAGRHECNEECMLSGVKNTALDDILAELNKAITK